MTYIPAPVAQTADTVTLSRRDWEALIEAIEDAEDLAAIAAHHRETAAGTARTIPGSLVARLVNGENPVRVWRDHRGLSGTALSARSGVAVSYISEIENNRKPGSAATLAKLATALDVSVEDLLRRQQD
jgi:DNA-binding Xre family transcriptional regulator